MSVCCVYVNILNLGLMLYIDKLTHENPNQVQYGCGEHCNLFYHYLSLSL